MTKAFRIGTINIGGSNPLVLIAGPCVIESAKSTFRHAAALRAITEETKIPFIFKTSYDKGNRTSIGSYRGPGLKKGLQILRQVKRRCHVPVLSDVHSVAELKEAKKVLDVIQIPAFLSRQTDLIVAAAKTGRALNIKKGQFMSPWEMRHVIKKAESARGNKKIMLTERGACFGYNNLVSDFRSLVIMRSFGYPIVYDATHSVQAPAGKGTSSGGDRKFVPPLSMAACACGIDALFMEVHEYPDRAPSDGPNMIRLSNLRSLLKKIQRIANVAGKV